MMDEVEKPQESATKTEAASPEEGLLESSASVTPATTTTTATATTVTATTPTTTTAEQMDVNIKDTPQPPQPDEETEKEPTVVPTVESTAAVDSGKAEREEEEEKPTTVEKNENIEPAATNETPSTTDIPVIAISDGEDDAVAQDPPQKPSKVPKRRNVGGSSAALSLSEEDHLRLKRRKINVAGAPKMPLTGYVRYMNERREKLRKEHPTKTALEHTRIICEEWHKMAAEHKAPYMKAAELDKQRYLTELDSFLKARPDILASELAKTKARKSTEGNNNANSSNGSKSISKEKAPTTNENPKSAVKEQTKKAEKDKEITPPPPPPPPPASSSLPVPPLVPCVEIAAALTEKTKPKRTPTPPTVLAPTTSNAATSTTAPTANTNTTTLVTPTPGEIPIFTNEFLEHNKILDMELRTLRKAKTDLEQQNAVLEKHVENMKFGVEKMITENNELQEKNRLLELYLEKLKSKLAQALASLPMPNAPQGATVENIDKYMQDLYKMATSNSHGPATLNKAKDIIRKLDLQIQL